MSRVFFLLHLKFGRIKKKKKTEKIGFVHKSLHQKVVHPILCLVSRPDNRSLFPVFLGVQKSYFKRWPYDAPCLPFYPTTPCNIRYHRMYQVCSYLKRFDTSVFTYILEKMKNMCVISNAVDRFTNCRV